MTKDDQIMELLKACDAFRTMVLEHAPKKVESQLRFINASGRFEKVRQFCTHEPHPHFATCMICGLYLDNH